MSIKTAFLALALGLAAAGAAQAQTVVNISVNTPRVQAPPARVVKAPPVRVQTPVRAPAVVHRAPPPVVQVSHVPVRPVVHAGRVPPPHVHRHATPARVQVGQQLSRQQLRQARDVDWRRAGLRAPQRGQQWVNLHGRHLLINMGTDRVLRIG